MPISSTANSSVVTHNLEPGLAVEKVRAALSAIKLVGIDSLEVKQQSVNSKLWTVFASGNGSIDSPIAEDSFRGSLTRTTVVPPKNGRDFSYVVWVGNNQVYDGAGFEKAVEALACEVEKKLNKALVSREKEEKPKTTQKAETDAPKLPPVPKSV